MMKITNKELLMQIYRVSLKMGVKVKVCMYLRSIKFKHKENFSYKHESNTMKFVISVLQVVAKRATMKS